ASGHIGNLEQAERALQEALDLARAQNDAKNAGVAMLWLAHAADDRGDHAESERLVASALALLEQLPPDDDLLFAYFLMASTRARAGRPREALALCHRALELAPAGSQRTPDVLSVQGWARTILGDPAGVEDNYEAVRLARRHVPTRL